MFELVSVVVTLCHLVTVEPNPRPIPVCFEKVPFRITDFNPNACGLVISGIAQWKTNSRYADDEYFVGAFRCETGSYQPKDAI